MPKLERAMLCINCEEVFEWRATTGEAQRCPRCGSAVVNRLAAWVPPLSDTGLAAWINGPDRSRPAPGR